eukprot:4798574-Pyramimonas_sp.AAC.1
MHIACDPSGSPCPPAPERRASQWGLGVTARRRDSGRSPRVSRATRALPPSSSSGEASRLAYRPTDPPGNVLIALCGLREKIFDHVWLRLSCFNTSGLCPKNT